MSITMQDVLKLSALKGCQILAGQSALQKTVASVSVLEYSKPTLVQSEIYQHIRFSNDEIVLTAFASVRDDVNAQCRNIETLAAAGEIGIILFYVGIIIPEVDPAVIDLANRLNFLIVMMPKNAPELTYSSVISEILFSVYNDQITNPNFSSEIVEKVSKMPKSRRNLNTVLRLLSDQLKVSLALVDARKNLVCVENWPRTNKINWLGWMGDNQHESSEVSFYQDKLGSSEKWQLAILKEQGQMTQLIQQRILETVRIALNLWGEDVSRDSPTAQLISAIMQARYQRAMQLAKQCHLNVHNFTTLLILNGRAVSMWSQRDIRQFAADIEPFIGPCLCEYYHDDIVVITTTKNAVSDEREALEQHLESYRSSSKDELVSVSFNHLDSLKQLTAAYEQAADSFTALQLIFPRRQSFNSGDIEFVHHCQSMVSQETSWLAARVQRLERLNADLQQTLLTFLLDDNRNIELTAGDLFVHPNTVKYRLKKLDQYFGFKVGRMPESLELYQLAACLRIMRGHA